MIRLIGILIGSAIAVAFLIIALGIPEFAVPEPTDTALPEVRPEVLPEPVPVASEPRAAVPEPPAPVAENMAPVSEILAPESGSLTAVDDQVLPVAETEATDPETEITIEEIAEPIEQHWYAFWSPFRSKIAADGFVSQLQRTTGLDYRVVKLKPGVYEVAFAYSDDSDIQHKLTQISSATGLDLSGG